MQKPGNIREAVYHNLLYRIEIGLRLSRQWKMHGGGEYPAARVFGTILPQYTGTILSSEGIIILILGM